MQITCKCGYVHKDVSTIKVRREPIRCERKLICTKCGKQLSIPSVNPSTFKKIICETKGAGYNAYELLARKSS